MSVGEKPLQPWIKSILSNIDDNTIELLLNKLEANNVFDMDDLNIIDANDELLMDICDDIKLNNRQSMKLRKEITRYLSDKAKGEDDNEDEDNIDGGFLILSVQEQVVYKKLKNKINKTLKDVKSYNSSMNENKNLLIIVNEILKITQNKLIESMNKQFEQLPLKAQLMYEEHEQTIKKDKQNQENDLKLLKETEKKWTKYWRQRQYAVDDDDNDHAGVEQKVNENDGVNDINQVLNQIKNEKKVENPLIAYQKYLKKLVSRIESNTKHLFLYQVGDNENTKCKSNEELIEENKQNKELINNLNQELTNQNELITQLKNDTKELNEKTKNINELNQTINNLNEEKKTLNLNIANLKENMNGVNEKLKPLNFFETIYDQLRISISNYECEVKSVYDSLMQQHNKNAPINTISKVFEHKKNYEQVLQNLLTNIQGVTSKVQNLHNNNNNLFTLQNIMTIIQDNGYFNVINPNKISPAFTEYNTQFATSENNNKVIKSTAQANSYLTYASSTGYSNGKYYWTMKVHNNSSSYCSFGVIANIANAKNNGYYISSHGNHVSYGYQGNMHNNNNPAITNACEVKILLDCDNKIVICYKDNVAVGFGIIPNAMNICYPAVSSYGPNNHIEVIS